MFLLSNICGCVPNLLLIRGITCSSICHNNYYITLGLTPNASQADIKKAYFELCKKYHPDKNDGSPESTKRFRDIAEAYEILGNEKSRKSYDQKMFYSRATMNQRTTRKQEDYNYEAEKYFYKRTNLRRRYTGKTAYFDFDAWKNAHYPNSRREEYFYSKYNGRTWRMHGSNSSPIYRSVRRQLISMSIFGFLIIFAMVITSSSFLYDSNYGVNRLVNRKIETGKPEPESAESSKENSSPSFS